MIAVDLALVDISLEMPYILPFQDSVVSSLFLLHRPYHPVRYLVLQSDIYFATNSGGPRERTQKDENSSFWNVLSLNASL